jgi:hypothetical protein
MSKETRTFVAFIVMVVVSAAVAKMLGYPQLEGYLPYLTLGLLGGHIAASDSYRR